MRIGIYSILRKAWRANCASWAAPMVATTMCDRYGTVDSLAPEFRKRVALSDYDREMDLRWHKAPPGRRRRLRALTEMLSARLLQAPEVLQHISYTHPYAHRPLVQFMLTIPRTVVCRPGEPRRLMRRALAEFLPPSIVKRKSKAVYNAAYREAVLPLAAELIRKPGEIRLAEFRYVDRRSFLDRLS